MQLTFGFNVVGVVLFCYVIVECSFHSFNHGTKIWNLWCNKL